MDNIPKLFMDETDVSFYFRLLEMPYADCIESSELSRCWTGVDSKNPDCHDRHAFVVTEDGSYGWYGDWQAIVVLREELEECKEDLFHSWSELHDFHWVEFRPEDGKTIIFGGIDSKYKPSFFGLKYGFEH